MEKLEEKNNMQEAVLKVQKLGVPPEGFEGDVFPGDEDFPDDDTIQLWDDWVEAVDSIKRPITWAEAEILIKCCPTEHMAGVEWTFLHCIESVFSPEVMEDYQNLIKKCSSDMMRNMLLERLQNYISNKA